MKGAGGGGMAPIAKLARNVRKDAKKYPLAKKIQKFRVLKGSKKSQSPRRRRNLPRIH